MTESPRRHLLRRARYATAGIVITAVAGTAGLTAVAANATGVASGGTGGTGTGTGTGGNAGTTDTGQRQRAVTGTSGGGVVQAPVGQPQAGSNAS